MSDEIDELRRRCRLGADLLWQELRELYGHVSCRLPSGGGFLIAFVRTPPAPYDHDEVMVFSYEGEKLEGEGPTPYEIFLHSEIFRRRPDVNSIVHSHPHVATALSIAGRTVYAVTQQSTQFGSGLPVFKGNFIDSVAIGAELAECLGQNCGALMKGHGAVLAGNNVAEAVSNTLYLEQAAKQQLWASMLGDAPRMPDELLEPRFPREEGLLAETNLWRHLVREHNRSGRSEAVPGGEP